MQRDPVSVIVPTYNRARIIARSVASVLEATAGEDEVIVVDDGSTDGTEEALAPFGSRIRYLKTPNRGAGAARNFGVQQARHDLIAFDDSDDTWMADKLDLQCALMRERPDVVFCFSDFGAKHEDGRVTHHSLFYWHEDPRPWDKILGPPRQFSEFAALPPAREDFPVYFGSLYLPEFERNYVAAFTLMVRRSAAGAALRFAEDVTWGEDWECFGRLARVGTAAFMDCETAWQSVHSGPRLTGASDFSKATDRLKMIPRVWGSDPGFLSVHGQLYKDVTNSLHLARARALISKGRKQAAREELKLSGAVPRSYRLLASLPHPVTLALLGCRRMYHQIVAE